MSEISTPGRASVRVVQASDPGAEAARLAAELGADMALDVTAAERAVRVRVDAGRQAVGSDGDAELALLARAPEARAAAAVEPPISDADVDELRHLAADLGRAARIRERTEARVVEVLQNRVAASSGVAIHPAAVATAAEAVVGAEAILAAAETELAAHDGAPGPQIDDLVPADEPVAVDDDPVLRQPHDDFDEALLERRRGGLRATGVAFVVVGAAVTAYALGAPVLVLPLAAVLAMASAVLAVARGRQAATRVDESPSSNLEAVVRAVEATEGGRRVASIEARESWLVRGAALEAARDEAQERLRVARNRWNQLAGPGADPHDPGTAVRLHDPQLAYDARVTDANPTVRTVAAFQRRVQARWRVLWASLGRDDPPPPDELESILDELLGEHRRALAELRRVEEAEARAAAAVAVRRPLLLVEPRSWVAPGRLAQLLASVPAEGEVILVEKG